MDLVAVTLGLNLVADELGVWSISGKGCPLVTFSGLVLK